METDLPSPAGVPLDGSRFLEVFDRDPEIFVVGEGTEMDHPAFVRSLAGDEQEDHENGAFKYLSHYWILNGSISSHRRSERSQEG